jgi:hypothetical protein
MTSERIASADAPTTPVDATASRSPRTSATTSNPMVRIVAPMSAMTGPTFAGLRSW